MAVSVESFSFSMAAQPDAQGPSSLLDDGFLYCILSATFLDPNSIGGSKTTGGPEGPFRSGFLSHVLLATSLDSNSVGGPEGPSAWRGFPYHTSPLTPTVWLLALTELYNSSTLTQSLEWHVWSSSSWNNCHAVHRSLSSGASVCSGTVGPSPSPILSAELTSAISFD